MIMETMMMRSKMSMMTSIIKLIFTVNTSMMVSLWLILRKRKKTTIRLQLHLHPRIIIRQLIIAVVMVMVMELGAVESSCNSLREISMKDLSN